MMIAKIGWKEVLVMILMAVLLLLVATQHPRNKSQADHHHQDQSGATIDDQRVLEYHDFLRNKEKLLALQEREVSPHVNYPVPRPPNSNHFFIIIYPDRGGYLTQLRSCCGL